MDDKDNENENDTGEEQWEISHFLADTTEHSILYLNDDLAVIKTESGMEPLFPEGDSWSGEHMEMEEYDLQLIWTARVIARTEFSLLAPRKMVNDLEGRSFIDLRCACYMSRGGICSVRMDHRIIADEDGRLNTIGRNTECRVPVPIDESVAFLDSVLGIPGRVRGSVAWFGGVKNDSALQDFFTLADTAGTTVWQVKDERRFSLL